MIKLDAVTMDFVVDLIEIVSMFLMLVVWRVNRRLPGTSYWALAAALYAPSDLLADIVINAGNGGYAVHDGSSAAAWSLAGLNWVNFVAYLALVEGVCQFRGSSGDRRVLRRGFFLTLLILYGVLSIGLMHDPLQRRLISGAFVMVVLLCTILALLWNARRSEFVVNGVISLFFVLMLFGEAGLWWTTFELGELALVANSPFMTVYLFITVTFVMGWTYGLSIACSFRVQHIMSSMAREDALTGLPNRRYVDEMIDAAINQSLRTSIGFGVVLIDLNKFKAVNDEYGHAVGDDLLIEVATRLRLFRRDTDFIGRLGGDEFIAITRNVEKAEAMSQIVLRLRNTLDGFATLRGQQLMISASMGAAFWPDDGELEQNLLHTADQRMYLDKASQKPLEVS